MTKEETAQIIDHLKNHRSVRDFQSRPVPEEILHEILESGLRASSSGNMQSYSVIVTQDQNLREVLTPLHFGQEMVREAPAFLTFCADFHRMREWLKLSDAPLNFDNYISFMIGAIDAILVSQNCALAAEAHGLGICYLGTTLANCQKIGDILQLPENVVPVVGFCLGYPNSFPDQKDRLPLEGIVHREQYQDYSSSDIEALYAEREQEGMKRYQSDERLRKMMDVAGAKNLAQVYTMAKYTRQSHLGYSKTVLDYLKSQNFLNH